jgi:hypothetical protein
MEQQKPGQSQPAASGKAGPVKPSAAPKPVSKTPGSSR